MFGCIDLQRDEAIKAELLAHEKSQSSFNRPPQDESSNSDEGMCYMYIMCMPVL